MATEKITRRKSGVELLKIIAMFLIVLSHIMPFGENIERATFFIDINSATENIQTLLLILFRHCGQIGNAIFVVCSAYFLIDSKKTKAEKIFNMIVDAFVISVTYLVIFYVSGAEINLYQVITNVFSVSYSANWFIGCYIVFYACHPLLNRVVYGISQKSLLITNIVALVVYGGISLLVGSAFEYSRLIGFFILYLITAYVKLYLPELSKSKSFNLKILIGSCLLLILLVIATNFLVLKVSPSLEILLKWCSFINPLIIFIALSGFNLLYNKSFYSKGINEVSSVTLFIYLLHENRLLSAEFFGKVWKYIYEVFTYEHLVLWAVALSIATFIVSTLLALVYKITIGRVTSVFCRRICNKASVITGKALERVLKIK